MRMRMPVALQTAFATAGDRRIALIHSNSQGLDRAQVPLQAATAAISSAGGPVGGDAGGSEAAFSSMASDRASGIRRSHSTKVVARLSFGRAAPTRAQLIP